MNQELIEKYEILDLIELTNNIKKNIFNSYLI